MRFGKVVRMWAAAVLAVFALLLIPVPAIADPLAADQWDACSGLCLGVSWDAVFTGESGVSPSLAIGQHSVYINIHPYDESGLGVPPDPTEDMRVGVIFTCTFYDPSNNGEIDENTGIVWDAATSWAEWMVGVHSAHLQVCANSDGETLTYVALVRREWNDTFGTQPTDYPQVLAYGTNNCPFSTASNGNVRTCSNVGGLDPPNPGGAVGVISIIGTGADIHGEYIDVSWDISGCDTVPSLGRPWGIVLQDEFPLSGPGSGYDANDVGDWEVDGTTGTHREYLGFSGPDNLVPGLTVTNNWVISGGLANYHNYTLICGLQGTSGCGGEDAAYYESALDSGACEAQVSDVPWDPHADGASGQSNCDFSFSDPNTWANYGCEIVRQLRVANGTLSNIDGDLKNLHVNVTVDGGSSTPTDTSGCTSGVLQTLFCLTSSIVDGITQIVGLLTSLFVPTSTSWDAINSLSTNFSTHPPGSLLTGAYASLDTAVSQLSLDSCESIAPISFGTTGPLAGISADWPDSCSPGSFTQSTPYRALYSLIQVGLYVSLAFAIWHMVAGAFSRGGE